MITTPELIESLTVLTERLIDANRSEAKHYGNIVPPVYTSGVRYKRHSDSHDTFSIAKIKHEADVVSLVAWRVAELRQQGEDAKPVYQWTQQGDIMHIGCLVRRGSGELEDVVKELADVRILEIAESAAREMDDG